MALSVMADLARTASLQHGVFTRSQAMQLGATRAHLDHGLDSGLLQLVHRGVYRFSAAPATWEAAVMAACLAGAAVASHRTAAVLWGLDGFRPGRVEVTRHRGTNFRAAGVRSHESLDLRRDDPVRRRDIPTTSVARTLLDLGAVVPTVVVERAVDDAIRRRLLTVESAWTCLLAHARRGRGGVASFRSVLEDRIPVGLTDSWFERLFLRHLEVAGIRPPVPQYVVSDHAGFVARVDMAWPASRVVVELDGKAFHLNADSFERDAAKRNRLRLAGWLVLVVTWKMFTERPEAVCGDIRRALRSHQPSSEPALIQLP